MPQSITEFSSGTSQWIKNNRHTLSGLPEPGEKWTAKGIGINMSLLSMLRDKDLIQRVERREVWSKPNLYQTRSNTYDAVQSYLEMDDEDGFLPCGHDPFVNQGDVLECKICEKEHRKEAVQ